MPYDALGRVSVEPWLYWSLLPIHRLFLSLYFRQIQIQGLEHLPVNGPVVFAPKHYSRWDPVVLGVLSLEPLWFMANSNQFEGVQEWFLRRLGAFPVDLARPKLSSFRYAIALLKDRKKLVMFPEGGIVRDQPVRPLKTGLARLLLQAETAIGEAIPVVPIAICYTPSAVWRAKVILHISPPIYLPQSQEQDEKHIAQAFTQTLESHLRLGMEQIGVVEK